MVNKKSKELKVISGLVLVSCIFVGGGIGFLINQVAVGGAIGMGIGFWNWPIKKQITIQLQPLFGALQRY